MRYSRQNKILELIKTHVVETQDQLQDLLEEAGYKVTQATISRDIKELQLVKVSIDKDRYKYTSGKFDKQPISERFVKIFRLWQRRCRSHRLSGTRPCCRFSRRR